MARKPPAKSARAAARKTAGAAKAPEAGKLDPKKRGTAKAAKPAAPAKAASARKAANTAAKTAAKKAGRTTAKTAAKPRAASKTTAKPPARKASTKTAAKTAAKKVAARKSVAKKAATKKTAAKSAARKAPGKIAAAKASGARASVAKPATKNTTSRKAAVKKVAAEKVAANKTGARKPAIKRAAPKTVAPKKAPAQRTAPRKSASKPAVATSPARKAPAARAPATPNPFLTPWPTGPADLPPFDAIEVAHYGPAFREAMRLHRDEVETILADPAPPTFANTIVPLETAGRLLTQVGAVFWNLVGSHADDALQALEREMAPLLSQHFSAITLDPRLFARVDAIWRARDALALDDEQRRVVERTHLDLVRGGARLDPAGKARVAEIGERLATLTSAFMQNVMKDEGSWRLLLDEADLSGLPEALRASAKRAAQDAGAPDKWAITLARSSVEGFLTFADRRDLREQAWRAWTARGDHPGERDNTLVLAEVVALRDDYARLMGFPNYAAFNLDDSMAKTPQAVDDLLRRVWAPACARAEVERAALAERARAMGENHEIEAWDWRYYAEKVRKEKYDFDEAALRPYLSLDAMIEAAFHTAQRLFGLRFAERKDAPRYHPDLRVWSVTDKGGAPVGLFLGDYFARPGKRSGAWMSGFRTQRKLDGDIRPVIVNVMNFARAGEGEPTLLSFDDARTLFHEFGHALHGLLSDVTYPSIAGTSVSRDFVELPSQLYEHWLETPEILGRFARHVATGAQMPTSLRDKLKAARNFNQGFATVEYTSCALLDMALYAREGAGALDMRAFERAALDGIGMPKAIVMRHRLPHFMHIVSGYAAGYYSYMWSEVMDADAFEAFVETGDVFDPATAKRLRDFIYAAGNRRDPAEAWTLFRGRAPSVEGLLRKRGLLVEEKDGLIAAPSGDA